MDATGTIIKVAGTDGPTEETRRALKEASGKDSSCVIRLCADGVDDPELIELVQLELCELANEFGLGGRCRIEVVDGTGHLRSTMRVERMGGAGGACLVVCLAGSAGALATVAAVILALG